LACHRNIAHGAFSEGLAREVRIVAAADALGLARTRAAEAIDIAAVLHEIDWAHTVLGHIPNGITRFPARFPSHQHVRSSEQRDRKTNRFKRLDARADHLLAVLHHGIGFRYDDAGQRPLSRGITGLSPAYQRDLR
jgi:hypothetical protein